MSVIRAVCQKKTEGTLGVEPKDFWTAADCSNTEMYPLLELANFLHAGHHDN